MDNNQVDGKNRFHTQTQTHRHTDTQDRRIDTRRKGERKKSISNQATFNSAWSEKEKKKTGIDWWIDRSRCWCWCVAVAASEEDGWRPLHSQLNYLADISAVEGGRRLVFSEKERWPSSPATGAAALPHRNHPYINVWMYRCNNCNISSRLSTF